VKNQQILHFVLKNAYKTHTFNVHGRNGQNLSNLYKINVFYQIEGRKYVAGITKMIDYIPLGMSMTNFSYKYYKMAKIAKNLEQIVKKCLGLIIISSTVYIYICIYMSNVYDI